MKLPEKQHEMLMDISEISNRFSIIIMNGDFDDLRNKDADDLVQAGYLRLDHVTELRNGIRYIFAVTKKGNDYKETFETLDKL